MDRLFGRGAILMRRPAVNIESGNKPPFGTVIEADGSGKATVLKVGPDDPSARTLVEIEQLLSK